MTEAENPQYGSVAPDRLRSIVDRIERLEAERKALSSDINDIYGEAKSAGFDPEVLRADRAAQERACHGGGAGDLARRVPSGVGNGLMRTPPLPPLHRRPGGWPGAAAGERSAAPGRED